jgi:hypothetical protein
MAHGAAGVASAACSTIRTSALSRTVINRDSGSGSEQVDMAHAIAAHRAYLNNWVTYSFRARRRGPPAPPG